MSRPTRAATAIRGFANSIAALKRSCRRRCGRCKERDAINLSYCVADAEFALTEADFIFAPERLNVAVTRARTKLIMIISQRLDAVPTDQEQMDKAELLREFVFAAAPKGETLLRELGAPVKVQLRLLGFDDAAELEELISEAAPEVAAGGLTNDLKDLLDAVKASALASDRTAGRSPIFRNAWRAERTFCRAWLSCTRKAISSSSRGKVGSASSGPRNRSTPSGRSSPRIYSRSDGKPKRRSASLVADGFTVLRNCAPAFRVDERFRRGRAQVPIDVLKDEGRLTYGKARDRLTVEWHRH